MSLMLVGVRGVGKTVLLDQMMRDAEEEGVITIRVEPPEGRSLPAMLAPQLRLGLLKLSRLALAAEYAIRGPRALAGFAKTLKFTYADIEGGFDYDPEPGLADNGDLEGDLTMLLEQLGLAAKAANTVVAIYTDERRTWRNRNSRRLFQPFTAARRSFCRLRPSARDCRNYAAKWANRNLTRSACSIFPRSFR